ncbi:RNA polymerase sigma-70 factor [Marinoscillum sp. MHG1-6]|uniref:RNA polymerase sigma-70 factor n=1 Tax=Marinoscillum sp. MHG1-6 TaxID=2959627 RepID=UPI0021574883|nr:RNA polymerase sigma-70 factor [Marinoscillum sp. MHG1-6]
MNLTDERVISALFQEHYQSLVSFTFQYVRDKDLSEELVQEVFAKLWADGYKIKIQTSAKSYLLGAVRNAALNYLKHVKVQNTYAQHQMYVASNDEIQDFLEYDELKLKLEHALKQLPEKCREIFELSRFEEKRYKEIANELGISLKTVENQMGKALKILRQELGDYLPILFFLMMR